MHVTGALHTTEAEVLAVSGLAADPPLIDVDTGRAEAALDRLPWVGSAEVRVEWPDSVTVSIAERHPLVAMPLPRGGFLLADASGRILATTVQRPAGLLEASGPVGAGRPGGRLPQADAPLLATAARLPSSLEAHVTAVSWQPGLGVELSLAAGQRVLLGSESDLAEQAIALTTLLDKVPLHGVATIDLRVPDSPLLTP